MIIRRFVLILYNIMCGLLCLLPQVARGQTSASYQGEDQRVPYVRKQQGVSWPYMLWKGGMVRNERGDLYLSMANGVNDMAAFNFVDGYQLGPHLTLGKLRSDRSRWELEGTVRWAFSRDALVSRGALRWYSPVERDVMVEAYGGRYTDDFDRHPQMSATERELASVLFAWNHFKLLERREAGIRLHTPLVNDLTLDVQAGWEKRSQQENHRRTNVFGAHPQDNVPRIRSGNTATGLRLYDGLIDGEWVTASIGLTYRPHSKHVVYDDLYCATQSDYPTLSLHSDLGAGSYRFATLEVGVEQTIRWKPIARLSYQAAVGTMLDDGPTGLADWHHLDASSFWWQSSRRVTHFALLENYELSTDRWWAEAHAEFCSHRLLLNRLLPQPGLVAEYVQCHVAQVADRPTHWEVHYGIDLLDMLRLGVAVGGDGGTYRGTVFTMTFDVLEAARR